MTISKFMATMGGASVILAMILGLYFLRWDGSADKDQARVTHNVEGWGNLWSRASPGFGLEYDDIALRGFPFGTKINLMHPKVTATLPEGKVVFSTAFLSFVPMVDKGYGYTLEFLADIVVMFYPADKSSPQSYMLHLSQVPTVHVQAMPVSGKAVEALNSWSVEMPERLVVNVLHANKSGQVGLNFSSGQTSQWLPIPMQIEPAIETLFSFLRTTVDKRD